MASPKARACSTKASAVPAVKVTGTARCPASVGAAGPGWAVLAPGAAGAAAVVGAGLNRMSGGDFASGPDPRGRIGRDGDQTGLHQFPARGAPAVLPVIGNRRGRLPTENIVPDRHAAQFAARDHTLGCAACLGIGEEQAADQPPGIDPAVTDLTQDPANIPTLVGVEQGDQPTAHPRKVDGAFIDQQFFDEIATIDRSTHGQDRFNASR